MYLSAKQTTFHNNNYPSHAIAIDDSKSYVLLNSPMQLCIGKSLGYLKKILVRESASMLKHIFIPQPFCLKAQVHKASLT